MNRTKFNVSLRQIVDLRKCFHNRCGSIAVVDRHFLSKIPSNLLFWLFLGVGMADWVLLAGQTGSEWEAEERSERDGTAHLTAPDSYV